MALIAERSYPLVVGIASGAIYLTAPALRNHQLPDTLTGLLSAMVSVAGIAVGFLATAKSILVSIDDKEIIRKLKKVGYYKRIIGYLRSAIRWSFALAVLSAAGMLIDLKGNWEPWKAVCFAIWLGVTVTAALSYYRVIGLFYDVLASTD
jgi:hypothetical protein